MNSATCRRDQKYQKETHYGKLAIHIDHPRRRIEI